MENPIPNKDVIAAKAEFDDVCQEYLFCLVFAAQGIDEVGKKVSRKKVEAGEQFWIATDVETAPKYHARMDMASFIQKSKKNGAFTNEICKSLLCSIYSLWDETYRHKIAKAAQVNAGALVAPLMGDLRKIRHCILHNKSTVPSEGMGFEVLDWVLPHGDLIITTEMFRDFVGLIRKKMVIRAASLIPEVQEVYDLMSKKEKKEFDNWYKKHENKLNNIPWPGFELVVKRIEKAAREKVRSSMGVAPDVSIEPEI